MDRAEQTMLRAAYLQQAHVSRICLYRQSTLGQKICAVFQDVKSTVSSRAPATKCLLSSVDRRDVQLVFSQSSQFPGA